MTGRRAWVEIAFAFIAGDAMALQSRGALLASFEGEFGVSQSLLGLIAPAGTLGFVLAIVLAGFLAGRVDARRVMGLGVILTIASLVVLASAPVYVLLLVGCSVRAPPQGSSEGSIVPC